MGPAAEEQPLDMVLGPGWGEPSAFPLTRQLRFAGEVASRAIERHGRCSQHSLVRIRLSFQSPFRPLTAFPLLEDDEFS